ncbi:uncharacterized protein PgNI_00097, partial [Pyricularia grisea]|uniref:Uncharacterized protein n=1 Tax=Pyricularia grisea TaxID=148305 RepID=A0A6P8BHX9_PYRGI
ADGYIFLFFLLSFFVPYQTQLVTPFTCDLIRTKTQTLVDKGNDNKRGSVRGTGIFDRPLARPR